MIGLMEGLRENLNWFPKCQGYLREHQPPTLIVWGSQDGYMPEGAAQAYLRDLPHAELHILDGGHCHHPSARLTHSVVTAVMIIWCRGFGSDSESSFSVGSSCKLAMHWQPA